MLMTCKQPNLSLAICGHLFRALSVVKKQNCNKANWQIISQVQTRLGPRARPERWPAGQVVGGEGERGEGASRESERERERASK